MTDLRALLARTADHVAAYREAAAEAAVFPDVDLDAVRAAIGGRLPDGPAPAGEVVDQLITAVEPAMVATTGPRYFGFVVGVPSTPRLQPRCSPWAGTSRRTTTCRRRCPPWSRRSPGPGSLSFWGSQMTCRPGSLPAPRQPTRCAWPRPAIRCSQTPDGTWSATDLPEARLSQLWRARSAMPRSTGLCVCSAWAPARFSLCPRTGTAPSTWPRWGTCWRASLLARRSCACSRATSTPGHVMTWRVRCCAGHSG